MKLEKIIKNIIPEENISHISNNEMRCYCPFHLDTRYSFSINLKTGLYQCNACSAKGNLKTLINEMAIKDLSLTPITSENIKSFCMFDNVEYSHKPTDCWAIKNRIEKLEMKKYSIEEIQKNILKGKTLIPAGIKDNAEKNFKLQQVFCMDFDNSENINGEKVNYTINNPYHISIEKILKYCEQKNCVPTFIYTTFSHTENQHKYRLIYIFEQPIENYKEANLIVSKLFSIFKDFRPDIKTKNLATMFFGGKNIAFYSGIVYKCEFETSRQIEFKDFDNFASFFNEDGKFEFDKFSKFLLNEYSIIKIDKNLHIYENGIYIYNTDLIEKLMFKYIPLKQSLRNEVLKYINLFAEEYQESSQHLIASENGIINLKSGELINFDEKKYIFKSKLSICYTIFDENNLENYKLVEDFFNKISCGNEKIKQLLFEIIGYCLYRSCSFKKIFIIIGDGNNGKSPYMKLINKVVGENNATNLSMEDITENGRFKLAELYGKLVNIADDETETDIVNSGLLKKLSAGGKINVEKKGKDPFEFYNYAKFIVSFNDNVRFNDTSFGFNERLIVVPFNCKILPTDEDYKENFEELLFAKKNLEYVLFKSVQAFKKVLETGRFTINADVKKAKDLYLYDNNPVLQFLSAHPIKNQKRTTDTYDLYKNWCTQNGIKYKTSNEFGKELKKLGYESKRIQKDNKRDFYYVKMT